MPIATRTFRVFVSSTFEDLKAERDALQREVFPKLRKLCEQHGARFQAIDLRWGVRDEAAFDQQTMDICLREIRRCQATGVKPNFIALLGDRYGWQPLPTTIPAAEFDALLSYVPGGDTRALAELWYRLDENAVPPEYCLRPRMGEFVTPDAWNPVERTLHEALARAARAAGLTATGLVKYEASATHQEILAGMGETGVDHQHVFGFFRLPSGEIDARLKDLKSYLRDRLFGNIAEFAPGDMVALCDAVFAQLQRVIEEEVKRFENRPALDLEVEAHDRLVEDRCRVFTGRQAVLDAIADYVRGPERRPLVLHGESGSGKSAVMAKASEQYQGPARMIRRFIGASPESASGHALLTSLCRQIAPGETPVDYAQLEKGFKERLSAATAEHQLVLFIDALDQLSATDPTRDLTCLPPELPPHVKVILSTTADGRRLPEGLPVRLERMAPSEAGQALDALLREAGRTLQPWQRDKVLAHFERCGLPLYLKLAAEESRLWKSYASQDTCTLGEGIAGVTDTLFDRLASNVNHGPTLVDRSLGYLAAGRYGLTEDEVLDVLAEDDAVWNDFDQRKRHEVTERRLPVVVWSRLSLDLEPYLTERASPGGTVTTFYHRQLAERVAGRFLAGAESRARHIDLARHFRAKPAWLDEGRTVPNTRRAVELVFQERIAQRWQEAEEALFDIQFLLAKCRSGMVLDLDADYQGLLQDARASSLPRHDALRLIHGALRLSLPVVAHDPAQFASQMVGRLLVHRDESAPAGWSARLGDLTRTIRLLPKRKRSTLGMFVDEIIDAAPRPWIRPLHPCLEPPGGARLRTLEDHSSVTDVAVTPDGKRAVSASRDKTLKVWDLDTGRALLRLEGHSGSVRGVAVTLSGKRAVSASDDETLKVWDLDTGLALRTLEGHSSCVTCLAVTADGKRAVSASMDETLKVWDLETGAELRSLGGPPAVYLGSGKSPISNSSPRIVPTVWAVSLTPDGKRAVSASSDALTVWDLDTGRVLRTLERHIEGEVCGVAVTPDGKRAVSTSSHDHDLKLWDLDSGQVVRTLKGHSGGVRGVAVTPNGKLAVSASADKTLRVWSLATGRTLRKLERNSGALAVTPDGKRAVSASRYGTLGVLDISEGAPAHETGRAHRTMQGHRARVSGVAVTPDGRRAVSTSEDKTLKVWDPHTGRALRTLEADSAYFGDRRVFTLAVTPDGRRAVCRSSDSRALTVWDLDTGRALRTLKGHSSSIDAATVTPDGKWVVSASLDETLKVWDLETGACLRTLEGHNCPYESGVTVTQDGKFIVSVYDEHAMRVWKLDTGTAWRTLHCEGVWSVAATPDGKRAVSASYDNKLKVWDLEMGAELHTFVVKTVHPVAVTSDGRHIVSTSEDRTLKLWDLTTGALLVAFDCVAPPLCCACASPNRIVAGDEDGRVYFLALEE